MAEKGTVAVKEEKKEVAVVAKEEKKKATPPASCENRPGHTKFKKYNLPQWVRHPMIEQPEQVGIMFPSEGQVSVGMMKDVKKNQAVQSMMAKGSKLLGVDLEAITANGPDEKLQKTAIKHVVSYIAGCAAFELLKAKNPKAAERPKGVAGFSVGEFTALYAAGVITFEQGLTLVKVRAEAIDAMKDECEMNTLIIYGYDYQKVEGLCTRATKKDDNNSAPGVWISQVLGPVRFVCAGKQSTINKFEEMANSGGSPQFMTQTWESAVNTPLAQQAADTLNSAIDKILPSMKPPKCELYLNSTGWRTPAGAPVIKFISAIKEQITSPVMWEGVVDQMQRWGIFDWYECGPNDSLKELMKDYMFFQEVPMELQYPMQGVTNIKV